MDSLNKCVECSQILDKLNTINERLGQIENDITGIKRGIGTLETHIDFVEEIVDLVKQPLSKFIKLDFTKSKFLKIL